MKRIESFSLDSVALDTPKYLLTFDDGYKDNHRIALPVLKQYGVPAIFFVATKPVGTDELLWYDKVRYFFERTQSGKGLRPIFHKKRMKARLMEMKKMGVEEQEECLRGMEGKSPEHGPLMMDWENIREAHAAGVLVGAHTHSHPIMMRLVREDQIREIRLSIEKIKENTGVTPAVFSYPEGNEDTFSEETIAFLEDAGVRFAFTTSDGVNLDLSFPYRLKRIGIKASDPVPVAALRLVRASIIKGKPGKTEEVR
jgi:peptidoglycan/xylan/chitin deacetylase (PgdA/CDA1 family)